MPPGAIYIANIVYVGLDPLAITFPASSYLSHNRYRVYIANFDLIITVMKIFVFSYAKTPVYGLSAILQETIRRTNYINTIRNTRLASQVAHQIYLLLAIPIRPLDITCCHIYETPWNPIDRLPLDELHYT